MIYKYVHRKLGELPIKEELKEICLALVDSQTRKGRKSKRTASSKTEIIIKICLKLLKIVETVFEREEIPSGVLMLQFIKSLTMQIYETQRIEIVLIKIRTYLLNIRWMREKQESTQKLVVRLNLFLQSLVANPYFDLVSQDFYSQIERLFIEAIRINLAEGRYAEASNFIAICFESFKRQFTALTEMLTFEEKKVYNIMEQKVQLFSLLFKLQQTGKMLSSPEKSSRTSFVFSKYQKIINRVPVPYDKDNLLDHFEVQINIKTKTEPYISDHIEQKNNRLSIMSIESVNNSECRRVSIRDSLLFIDELERRKSKTSSIDSINELTPLNLTQPRKVSRFRHEHPKKSNFSDVQQAVRKVGRAESEGLLVSKTLSREGKEKESKDVKFRIHRDVKSSSKQRKKSIIEPKKFNLVMRADNEAKEKLKTCDPLKNHPTLLKLHLNRGQTMKGGLFVNIANLQP